ncbi:MAG: hypothetical protein K1000chlam2_01500 [Chlamydiae bacterium]|nr:hypothetical protein [Chlamydiota bacterium]
MSPDPMGELDGPNLYVYCRNNPLTYVDYFGLASEKNKSPIDESYFYGEYEREKMAFFGSGMNSHTTL